DTMLLSYVLEGGKHGHDNLAELANLYLGRTTAGLDTLTGTGRERISFCEVDIERAATFAAENAEVALALHQALKPRLLSEHLVTVYETLERPLVSVLANMERAGIKVDSKALEELSED